MDHNFLFDIVWLLAAGVVLVPLFQKTGLGSVLGYLVAGVILGPWGIGAITATESMVHVSELGVVFLLFIIGLELEPRRLWAWRMPIFGMGLMQVVGVSLVVALGARVFGLSWPAALVCGMAAAMSSTAIATQFLRERNLLSTSGGSSAFSILLFQDMAVIPILALLPHLAGEGGGGQAVSPWIILGVMIAVVVAGQFLLRHILRLVAGARLREVFTALSLLLVVGMAALMQSLGVSMALGAFIAGVLLATSEYKHAIEMDIEPFKGLLLGLFFMSVGMSVDISAISRNPGTVLGMLGGLVAAKLAVHFLLARAFRIGWREVPLFAILISQVGEFAFVLLSSAQALKILDPEFAARMSAAVALSMATTPLLILFYDKWWSERLAPIRDVSNAEVRNDHPEVLIAGFGRVGQIVGRILYANNIQATVLDHDPDQIEFLRQFGFKVYYGDATRLDLLEAAGAATAKVLVVAIDDMEDSLQVIDEAQKHFPHLQIVARARNVAHVYELIDRKVKSWERETFDSSLRMSTEVLKYLGWEAYSAVKAAHQFRVHNLQVIHDMHGVRKDQARLVSAAKQARADLEKMMSSQRTSLDRDQEGWNY